MSQFGVVRSTLENISLITASKALVSVTVVSGDNALTRWELRMESLWDRRLMWGFFQGSYFILFYYGLFIFPDIGNQENFERSCNH